MANTHEIITIQAGNYANFVGTHWWNMQESSFCYDPNATQSALLNHDVLFREGINHQKEVTYTPRLVMIDVKHKFKKLRRENDIQTENSLWEGSIDVIKEDTEQSENSSCEAATPSGSIPPEPLGISWSDFLKTSLHPKSLCLLDDLFAGKFESYNSGEEMYRCKAQDNIEDTLRQMTEECDYLQGFHLIFDAYNGFSGLSSCLLQHLDEEYRHKPSLCFPVYQDKRESMDTKNQLHRLHAVLMSMAQLNSFSSLFSPLCLSDDLMSLQKPYTVFPHLSYNEDSEYETSSILACALETLTSQYRLKSKKATLFSLTNGMSLAGRKLVSTSLSLPFPLDLFLDRTKGGLCPLTPLFSPKRSLVQSGVLRGVPPSMFHSPPKSPHALAGEDLFGHYLNQNIPSCVCAVCVFDTPCSVCLPFPQFFAPTVGIQGFLHPRPTDTSVQHVPVAASLANTDCAADLLHELFQRAGKVTFKEYAKCTEKDEFQEVLENLTMLQENYIS